MSQSKPGAGFTIIETVVSLLFDVLRALPFAAMVFALAFAAIKIGGQW